MTELSTTKKVFKRPALLYIIHHGSDQGLSVSLSSGFISQTKDAARIYER